MSQSEEPAHNNTTTEYVVLEIKGVHSQDRQEVAIGVYKTKEGAYAEALTHSMQSIENESNTWSKSILAEKQAQIIELCRYIKEDLSSFEERFNYMTTQVETVFKDLCKSTYKVLSVSIHQSKEKDILNESVFKTKVRNFLDVFQSRSDIEEDLGNSDDEEEEEEDDDDEEDEAEEEDEEDLAEEEEEEEEEGDIEEEDLAEEEEVEEEGSDVEEDEEEEQLEEEEEDEEETNTTSLKRTNTEDDEEEDEIDEEDGDEDELDDDDENTTSKRRRLNKES